MSRPTPLYSSNKLTLTDGFTPPPGHPLEADIVRVSVGTDPGLALSTRKGTGLYKVPSLKGVWYRGRYLHDGAVTSLEEMFDAARLQDDFVPSGFLPPQDPRRKGARVRVAAQLRGEGRAHRIPQEPLSR